MELNQDQLALIGVLLDKKQMYYRLAYSLLSNEADALDAISQMTLQVVEKIHTLRSNEAFIAWSRQILVNVCREFWRRNPEESQVAAYRRGAERGRRGGGARRPRRRGRVNPQTVRFTAPGDTPGGRLSTVLPGL